MMKVFFSFYLSLFFLVGNAQQESVQSLSAEFGKNARYIMLSMITSFQNHNLVSGQEQVQILQNISVLLLSQQGDINYLAQKTVFSNWE